MSGRSRCKGVRVIVHSTPVRVEDQAVRPLGCVLRKGPPLPIPVHTEQGQELLGQPNCRMPAASRGSEWCVAGGDLRVLVPYGQHVLI